MPLVERVQLAKWHLDIGMLFIPSYQFVKVSDFGILELCQILVDVARIFSH